MIEYLNNAENINEYYNRIDKLYPLIVYENQKRKFENTLKYWNAHVKYTGLLEFNRKFVDSIQDMVSYFIYSWPISSYLIENIILNNSTNSHNEIKDLLDGCLESKKLDIAYAVGFINKDCYDNINKIGDYRHNFAHSSNVINELYSQDKKLENKFKFVDNKIQNLTKKVFGITTQKIYNEISPLINNTIYYMSEDVSKMPTYHIHKVLYRENMMKKEMNEEDYEFLPFDKDKHINNFKKELKSRDFDFNNIFNTEPKSDFLPKSIKNIKYNYIDNSNLLITNINYDKIISKNYSKKCSLDIEISDIISDNQRKDKILKLKYGCIIDNNIVKSEIKNLKNKNYHGNIINLNFEIPSYNNNEIITDIEFFVTGIYGERSYINTKKYMCVNIEEVMKKLAQLEFTLYSINNNQYKNQFEYFDLIKEYINESHWLLSQLESVIPNKYSIIENKYLINKENIKNIEEKELEELKENINKYVELISEIREDFKWKNAIIQSYAN